MLYETARALKRGFKHTYTFNTDKTPLVFMLVVCAFDA